MAADRPVITLGDLDRLREQENKPQALTANEVTDYAIAAALVLRGLERGQKIRVINRMRKLI